MEGTRETLGSLEFKTLKITSASAGVRQTCRKIRGTTVQDRQYRNIEFVSFCYDGSHSGVAIRHFKWMCSLTVNNHLKQMKYDKSNNIVQKVVVIIVLLPNMATFFRIISKKFLCHQQIILCLCNNTELIGTELFLYFTHSSFILKTNSGMILFEIGPLAEIKFVSPSITFIQDMSLHVKLHVSNQPPMLFFFTNTYTG